MSDYISRDAAKVAVQNALAFHSYAGGKAASALDKIPAADVRPVVRGKWIPIECIVGSIHINYTGCSVYKHTVRDKTRFCPNCGAEMKEEV